MKRPASADPERPFGVANTSSFISRSPAETRTFACTLARSAPDGTVFALCGDLGSGKTCFAQGLALALGIDQPVTSPTFALIREYRGTPRRFAHIDLYRLDSASDLDALGIDDYLEPDGLAAFEWADRMPAIFPDGTVWVRIESLDRAEERRIAVKKTV